MFGLESSSLFYTSPKRKLSFRAGSFFSLQCLLPKLPGTAQQSCSIKSPPVWEQWLLVMFREACTWMCGQLSLRNPHGRKLFSLCGSREPLPSCGLQLKKDPIRHGENNTYKNAESVSASCSEPRSQNHVRRGVLRDLQGSEGGLCNSAQQ